MNTVKYSIPNISCGHCTRTIENELSELEGVRQVKADATAKSVEISFEAPADEAGVRALLVEINFPPAD